MRTAGLVLTCALLLAGCGNGKSTPAVDAGEAELRALTCPDGGCVSVTCPSPSTLNSPSECPGSGKSWLKDQVTGACCEFDCWSFFGEGFTRFTSQAECEALPQCDGTPVGGVLPAGDGCNTCTCVAADRWDCTTQNCTGGPVGKACGFFQGGCPETQYCAFVPAERCSTGDAPSVCLDRPSSCTSDVAPVCACNGREYINRCEAARDGSGIGSLGSCQRPASCVSSSDCATDEYCLRRACAKRPLACVNQFAPVCGKDERSYGNACLAAMAGADVRKEGFCTGSCSSRDECAPDEYCSACTGGQCLPRANSLFSCTTVDVVCGCDGQTYGCPELTHANGTSVAHAGHCP